MPSKLKLVRRLAVGAFTVWKGLPPKQKQRVLGLAKKHGPKIAKQVVKARAGKK